MISKPDYHKYAEYYDDSESSGAEVRDHTNDFIERMLKKYKVKTVLDLTCGTGSQVFLLAKRDYSVVGADISSGMLKIAKRKAKKQKINVKFLQGDMCSLKVGNFDAVITIFNAVGHLTKTNFEKAMRNIRRNLNDDGLYLFDIYNTNMNAKLEAALKVDAITTVGTTKIRKIQICKINKKNGIMTMTEEEHVQTDSGKSKIKKWKWTMQTYTAKWLENMLIKNGFKVLNRFGPNGSKFSEKDSSSILIIAREIPS